LWFLCASPLHAAADNPSIEVWKSATCECCGNWVKHLEANGFAVKVNATEPGALERLKAQVGIGSKLAVCHTAKIGSYIIEGHVPATDIKRLVAARRRPRRSRHACGLARNGARLGI
jgi:hypothetical protein